MFAKTHFLFRKSTAFLVVLYFTAFFSLIIICSCSRISANSQKEHNSDFTIRSLDIYLARASIGRADFEQYFFGNDLIIMECGPLSGAVNDKHHSNVINLTSDQTRTLYEKVSAVMARLKQGPYNFDRPGSLNSIFDEGQIIFKVESQAGENFEIQTSLRSLESMRGLPEKNIRDIILMLRSADSKHACSRFPV